MSTNTPAPPTGELERFVRSRDLEAITGYRRQHIYRLMKAGEFPRAVRLGIRAVGWRESNIRAWQASRPEAADAPFNNPAPNMRKTKVA